MAERVPHYLRSEACMVWSGIHRNPFKIHSTEEDQPFFFTQKICFIQSMLNVFWLKIVFVVFVGSTIFLP